MIDGTKGTKMKLSEDLIFWRAERPDEWTMDRFIGHAKKLEEVVDQTKKLIEILKNESRILK